MSATTHTEPTTEPTTELMTEPTTGHPQTIHPQGTSMRTTTSAPAEQATTDPRQPTASAPAAAGFHPVLADVGPAPFARLVRVELRKLVDTRAGRGVLLAILAITAVSMGVTMWTSREAGAGLMPLMLAASTPQAVLLPVLGIMTAANEWSQRTALVTFTQEPRRLRVMAAKAVSAVLLGMGVLVVTLLLAVLGHVVSAALADGAGVDLSLGAASLTNLSVAQVQGVLMGVAFGALLLNVPLGIVAYFLVPVASGMAQLASSWLAEHAGWFDMTAAMVPLLSDAWLTGQQWAQLGTSSAVWVLLPLVIGCWRVLHKEVK